MKSLFAHMLLPILLILKVSQSSRCGWQHMRSKEHMIL
jgi:hypothetical protein